MAARIILARAMPALVQLTKLAWQDPRQALAGLRSADAVHPQGRVSGDGWNGRRYSFELTDDQHRQPVTGTVDVDQAGRVRRLEVVSQLRTSGGRMARTLRTVMEFRDYGAHEPVSAPPAGEVVHAPGARVRLAPDPPTARTERHSQP